MREHVLIAGGRGFIGRHLVRHLADRGYNVTIVSRMPGPTHLTWYDLCKNGIPKDVSIVVNVAGRNLLDPTKRWTTSFKQNIWTSRIHSSDALVKAIADTPNVNVYVSICGVNHYRPLATKTYTENDKVEAYDYMSTLSLNVEQAAILPSAVASRCRAVQVRTGTVMGRCGGIIGSLWLPFKLGLGGPIGSGTQIQPWIHVIDLVRLIRHCVENTCYTGAVNAVAPHVLTNAEFSKIFAHEMHRPCSLGLPETLLKCIYGHDRLAMLLKGAKIKPERALQNGFEFKYPTAEAACRQVVAEPSWL